MQSQKITIIHNSLQACLKNEATFAEHIKNISAVGVLGYKADLLKYTVTYKMNDQTTHIEQLPNLDIKPHADFHKESVQAAVKEAQKGNIDYLTFLKIIIDAGTIFYEVNIVAKQVTYVGGNHESYLELFPSQLLNPP